MQSGEKRQNAQTLRRDHIRQEVADGQYIMSNRFRDDRIACSDRQCGGPHHRNAYAEFPQIYPAGGRARSEVIWQTTWVSCARH